MNHICISITYFNNRPAHMIKLYYKPEIDDFEIYRFNTYKQAMTEMRKMERRLHKSAILEINQFDKEICTKVIRGKL